MTPEALLQVRDLRIAFDSEHQQLIAVDGVSFDLHAGECLGLVGESGSGKSVTAMSLARLLPQPSGRILGGSIRFEDKDVTSMTDAELRELRGNKIGYIFQEPMNALNPVHRVGDQLIECLQLHQRCRYESAREQALDLLKQVRIPAPASVLDRFPHELSGGMRQRVVIAMALSCKPQLLISDEATTALDVTVQHQILKLIKELQAELRAACLLITHELGIVAQTCDRVAVMYAGRIVEVASVEDLFAHPLHAYTRALLDCIPSAASEAKSLLPTIEGQVAPLDALVTGCRFCQRLGRDETELSERPAWKEVRPDHWVEACPHCVALTETALTQDVGAAKVAP